MREDVGIETSHKDSVYDVAKEDLELQGCPFPRVLGVLFMYLLVYSANCIAIAYFEFGEILVFGIEAFFKVGNGLHSILALSELHYNPLQLRKNITLKIRKYFEQFGMSLLIFPVIFDALLVQQVQNHLVDVEFES